jgi:hypothetical protein
MSYKSELKRVGCTLRETMPGNMYAAVQRRHPRPTNSAQSQALRHAGKRSAAAQYEPNLIAFRTGWTDSSSAQL